MGGSKERVTSSCLSWQRCVSEWVAASLHKEGHAVYLSFPAKGMRTANRKICLHGTWARWTTAHDLTAMAEGELRNCPEQPPVCAGALRGEIDLPKVMSLIVGGDRNRTRFLNSQDLFCLQNTSFFWLCPCLLTVHWPSTHLNAEIWLLCGEICSSPMCAVNGS